MTAMTAKTIAPGREGRRDPVRADIQALRALAVTAVVIYHAYRPVASGGFVGVDIFFVISGYLIGGALIRELVERGRIRLSAFYARRARRILPMSLLVTTVSLVTALVVASPIRMLLWNQPLQESSIVKDGISATLYVPNLWFAAQQADYLASPSASPFLHYWSLGIEEQFYLLVPVALGLAWIGGRRTVAGLGWTVGLGTVASFGYCSWLTHVNPTLAFYHPGARAWELGVGVCVALAGHSGRVPPGRISVLMARSAGLLVLAATLRGGSFGASWPGWVAVVPVAASAALLWAGSNPAVSGRGWWNVRPLQRIGNWSYSIYLWHWPALVFAALIVGRELRLRETAAIIVAVIGLSALSYRFVELPNWGRPVQTRRQKARILGASALGVLGALAVAGLVGLFAARLVPTGVPTASPTTTPTLRPVEAQDFAVALPNDLRPQLADAKSDNSRVYRDGCHLYAGEYVIPAHCTYGPGSRPFVVVFGDSHAAQWIETFATAADRGELTLVSLTASGCAPLDLPLLTGSGRSSDDCGQWRVAAIKEIDRVRPDVIVMSSNYWYSLEEGTNRAAVYAKGLSEVISGFPEGTRLVVIGDTGREWEDPVECAAAHPSDLSACSAPREKVTKADVSDAVRAVAAESGAVFFDPVPYMCSDDVCGVVIDDVFVFRDTDHVTVTFSRRFDALLFEAAGLGTRSLPSDSP
jgi:peptidoglycan/LPS O-acetylase OafA/YrhL